MRNGCAAVLLLAGIPGPAFSAAKDHLGNPPHVLLITIDTLRADHLSCYGYDRNTSPNIDRLASEGVRFDRAYTTIPLTGPAHFSLLTGRYPQEHGARNNGVAAAKAAKVLFLPQVLRMHGYRAGAFISAWPLTSRLTHLNRWFDDYDETLIRRYKLFNSSRYAEDVTPLAVRWLERNARRHFFLWVHYFDPHSPYEWRDGFAPGGNGARAPAYRAQNAKMRDRIARYDSEIAYTDAHVGILLETLDRLALRNSTLVILAADHGESLGEHSYVGHGKHLYQDIVRVPLIFRLPGVAAPGKTIPERVSLLDVAPTVADLTVGPAKANLHKPFAGRSLAAALTGDADLAPRSIWYLTFGGEKLFFPRWLSWLWAPKADLPLRIGREDGNRKLVWSPAEKSLAIFDTGRDPLEVRPHVVGAENAGYERETPLLSSWFKSTDVASGESALSEHNLEVLRSLGYLQ
ncbi:MAG: sulfatase [Acidobacteriota bacterium]